MALTLSNSRSLVEAVSANVKTAGFMVVFKIIKFGVRLYRPQQTRTFAVAERPRDASCLSVVSFNSTKRRVDSVIVSYVGYRLSLCVVKCAVLLSLA